MGSGGGCEQENMDPAAALSKRASGPATPESGGRAPAAAQGTPSPDALGPHTPANAD